MVILSTKEMKAWDDYTIESEPISPLNLMERAAQSFVAWFLKSFPNTDIPVYVFCGTGNNGGDGVAIARMLSKKFYTIHVVICNITSTRSKEFIENFERVKLRDVASIQELDGQKLPELSPKSIFIDAILGIGLTRPIERKWGKLIQQINAIGAPIVSVDIPSGLIADGFGDEFTIRATKTVTFQSPKLAFFFAENEAFVGDWHVVEIGLDKRYLQSIPAMYSFNQLSDIQSLVKNRRKHAHKGDFGTALLVTGSKGMMGASVLATKAAVRSGAGIVYSQIPALGSVVVHTAVPEAIVIADPGDYLSAVHDYSKYDAIGIGCGIGTDAQTVPLIQHLLESDKFMVLDADALNAISRWNTLPKFPVNTIITPHPKEFDRLFGAHSNSKERLNTAREQSVENQIIIILKGAYSAICLPDGSIYFNSTGNPGMATAGSGDVLTGILTGLLARGYLAGVGAMLGVYLHGLAGDLAREIVGEEALVASDIIESIPAAFKKIYA